MSQNATVNPRPTFIAPNKTTKDWDNFSKSLVVGGNADLWAEAFESYFFARLQSRYLGPIKMIQESGGSQGEGFTIASIQCALIEFLAATRVGKNYRFKNPRKPYEYNQSGELFVDFLFRTRPFDKVFSKANAQDFYSNVRCALLHEARTKGGWIIWAGGQTSVDCQRKIVYRDSFQLLIEQYITEYGLELTTNASLQEAFLRKFNDLAV